MPGFGLEWKAPLPFHFPSWFSFQRSGSGDPTWNDREKEKADPDRRSLRPRCVLGAPKGILGAPNGILGAPWQLEQPWTGRGGCRNTIPTQEAPESFPRAGAVKSSSVSPRSCGEQFLQLGVPKELWQ